MDIKTPKKMALHITEKCMGMCPMCYAGAEVGKEDGDLETLKTIVHNAIVAGEVEYFVFVGGDPCLHPNLVELLKYAKTEGEKYGVKVMTSVLSNSHEYKENGKVVPMQEVMPYLDEVSFTIHGENALEHDVFNGIKGSYKQCVNAMKEFATLKTDEQILGVTVNLMPHTVKNGKLERIMKNMISEFDPHKIDLWCVQRIAPVGRALEQDCGGNCASGACSGNCNSGNQFLIERQDGNAIMEIFNNMAENEGHNFDICDVLPYCSIDKKYHHLLPKGGCYWGKEMVAVYQDGSLKRCAMSRTALTKTMQELDTPEKWIEFWNTDPEIQAFKTKAHLNEACKRCKLLEDCGGGCRIASGIDDYMEGKPNPGKDPLSI